MKRVKKVALVGILGSVLLFSTGCTEAGLRSKVKELEAQVEALQLANEQLKIDKENLTITEESLDTSLREVEGTSVPAFQTIDGVIKFPNKLFIPDAFDDANNSYMMVGSKYTFTPSDNWLTKMSGATLELNHPSKIWGNIKSVGIEEGVAEENMKDIVQRFFVNFPATNISYRKIFMEEKVVGMIAKASIEVDAKPHVVNVGFVTRGEYGLLMLFDYEDNQSGVQQELIDLLISTGKYGDIGIKLE